MPGIRYGYNREVRPHAPFVNVVLQHPSSGDERRNAPAQIDTGADRTVMPEKWARALGLPQVGYVKVGTLGGAYRYLPSFAALLGIHDFPLRRLEIVADSEEQWMLLGLDVLNAHRIVLDGPKLSLEIG